MQFAFLSVTASQSYMLQRSSDISLIISSEAPKKNKKQTSHMIWTQAVLHHPAVHSVYHL